MPLMAALLPHPAHALDVLRRFDHPHLGRVTVLTPDDWVEEVHVDAATGNVELRLLPPTKGLFDLRIVVNELVRLPPGPGMQALGRRELESYLKVSMADAVSQSVEGQVVATRFGLRRDESVYARLTDRAPPAGEFRILTQGVRLLGRRAMLFTLYSDDADGVVLKRALDVMSSFAFVG